MALPQGINFRMTAAYVTDPANTDYEINAGIENYPHVTAQGNNVGWESGIDGATAYTRDRSLAVDPRLAGICFVATTLGPYVYRIDLPAAGDYRIRLAAGDASFGGQPCKVELFDNVTSLGVLSLTNTVAVGGFRDATDVEHTAANWPANNNAVVKTFASTILRFKLGVNGVTGDRIAHFYVEAVAAAPSGDASKWATLRSPLQGVTDARNAD